LTNQLKPDIILKCYRCSNKLVNSIYEVEGFLWVDETCIHYRLCKTCAFEMDEFWLENGIDSAAAFQSYLDIIDSEGWEF